MPVRMTREGRAETREAKRTEQDNQKSKSGKTAGFSSTSQKGNIVHGKLKSQKELKKITGSEDYKKSDYEGKTKMLNVATAKKGLASRTHGSDKPNKEIGKQSFKKNFSFSGKQMSDHYKARKSRTQSVSRMNPVPYLTGGQAKIAAKAPPPNKIDAKDFAVLRAEKAKGRGMGLQDEKVKPGKVIKAKRGTGILAEKGTSKNFAGYTKVFEGPRDKGRVATISGVKPKIKKSRKTYKSMDEMRKAKGFKPGETASQFNKRRMMLAGAKEAAKATRIGKIVLPIAAAGVAAQQYLKSKMKKDKNKKTLKDFREQKKPGVPSEKTKTINSALNKLKAKKMGGGMMQKPIGYKSGMGPGGAAGSMAGRPGGRRPMQQGPKGGIGSLSKNRSNDDLVILVNSGDGKVIKMKRSDFKNNMSPPKKKMGGGMMQKPMGYSTGGPSAGYKSKEDRKKAEKNIKEARSKEGLRSFLSSGNKINQPMRKERYMEGRKARHSAFKKKLGRTAARIASSLNPVTTAASVIGKVMGKGSKKRDFQKGDYGDISVKKMGGGMMQKPMGYRSGTMVKARGCKLGRTKPTKIT